MPTHTQPTRWWGIALFIGWCILPLLMFVVHERVVGGLRSTAYDWSLCTSQGMERTTVNTCPVGYTPCFYPGRNINGTITGLNFCLKR